MYPTYAGLIGCTMLALWPHKYKVGHIDLILIKYQNLLNSPEIPKCSCVSHCKPPSHGMDAQLPKAYFCFELHERCRSAQKIMFIVQTPWVWEAKYKKSFVRNCMNIHTYAHLSLSVVPDTHPIQDPVFGTLSSPSSIWPGLEIFLWRFSHFMH